MQNRDFEARVGASNTDRPSKRVRISYCDSIYTIYLSLCTQSADPNLDRGTHYRLGFWACFSSSQDLSYLGLCNYFCNATSASERIGQKHYVFKHCTDRWQVCLSKINSLKNLKNILMTILFYFLVFSLLWFVSSRAGPWRGRGRGTLNIQE